MADVDVEAGLSACVEPVSNFIYRCPIPCPIPFDLDHQALVCIEPFRLVNSQIIPGRMSDLQRPMQLEDSATSAMTVSEPTVAPQAVAVTVNAESDQAGAMCVEAELLDLRMLICCRRPHTVSPRTFAYWAFTQTQILLFVVLVLLLLFVTAVRAETSASATTTTTTTTTTTITTTTTSGAPCPIAIPLARKAPMGIPLTIDLNRGAANLSVPETSGSPDAAVASATKTLLTPPMLQTPTASERSGHSNTVSDGSRGSSSSDRSTVTASSASSAGTFEPRHSPCMREVMHAIPTLTLPSALADVHPDRPSDGRARALYGASLLAPTAAARTVSPDTVLAVKQKDLSEDLQAITDLVLDSASSQLSSPASSPPAATATATASSASSSTTDSAPALKANAVRKRIRERKSHRAKNQKSKPIVLPLDTYDDDSDTTAEIVPSTDEDEDGKDDDNVPEGAPGTTTPTIPITAFAGHTPNPRYPPPPQVPSVTSNMGPRRTLAWPINRSVSARSANTQSPSQSQSQARALRKMRSEYLQSSQKNTPPAMFNLERERQRRLKLKARGPTLSPVLSPAHPPAPTLSPVLSPAHPPSPVNLGPSSVSSAGVQTSPQLRPVNTQVPATPASLSQVSAATPTHSTTSTTAAASPLTPVFTPVRSSTRLFAAADSENVDPQIATIKRTYKHRYTDGKWEQCSSNAFNPAQKLNYDSDEY